MIIGDVDTFDKDVTAAGGRVEVITPIGETCVAIFGKAFGDDLKTIILVDGSGPFTMSTFFISGDRTGQEFLTPLTPTHFAVLKVLERYAPREHELRGILDRIKEEN